MTPQVHSSDCAIYNEPYKPAGECDCGFKCPSCYGRRLPLRMRLLSPSSKLWACADCHPEEGTRHDP